MIESLQKYLSDADTPLMQAHINDCLKVLAAGFVDQKGAADGFGPDSNNQATITQEASLEKLDKFHTHSRSNENAFGHMDNLLRQTGPQGFEKAIQAMQIASAKDLVFNETHSWRYTTLNKRKQLANIQFDWSESQRKLLDNGVKEAEVNALQRAQAMTKLIASLKKHNGPLNSNEEIDAFLKTHKKASEKELARMLNEEIRFRQDSNLRFSVSKDCYLYRQHGISNDLRVKNLRLLVQRPDARSTANIEDLRQVIITSDHVQDTALRAETNVAPGQTENAQVYRFKETKNSVQNTFINVLYHGLWTENNGSSLLFFRR